MSVEITIERRVRCGNFGYIVRENPDFPEGTIIAYRDQMNLSVETELSLPSAEELDALIVCLQARRAELK